LAFIIWLKNKPLPKPMLPKPMLPEPFLRWFAAKGWQPRAHQIELLAKAQAGHSVLLIAPTGAGKTLAGFLPSLVTLNQRTKAKLGAKPRGVQTLYISPLKALAVDIERNLAKPVAEMGLRITIETRTGDTPVHKRQRQKLVPPDILLTTPEQLALLLSSKDAALFFEDLKFVILDELHSLVTSKRGHLLSLDLARLHRLCQQLQTIGLSATVANPLELRQWLVPQNGSGVVAELVTVADGAAPQLAILPTNERIPWAGHSARYAMGEIYQEITKHATTLLFVNTRSQAEFLFQELWKINDQSIPIALHHGSLDASQRRKVEQAMASDSLRAVVATSTLDMGIDWGNVDLVIHVGAPKGASRLAQRIGRANHRLDEPSKAFLVPANRFEVLECQAAINANYVRAQDTAAIGVGTLDVLAQHVLGMACAEPFDEEELYTEVISALPYQALSRAQFQKILEFVASGGYALKVYDRYARIKKTPDGKWRIANPMFAKQYRLNVGTIVEAPVLNVRMVRQGRGIKGNGGPALGKVEESFLEMLTPGDTFLFAGKVLRFEGIRENECYVSNAHSNDPKIPAYAGGRFPLSTYLAQSVREILSDEKLWHQLPDQVCDWLAIQAEHSMLPPADQMLVETFPDGERFYLAAYPFEGRLAHQTLGMLLTRRLERAGAKPLGFVASDYSICVWGLRDLGQMIKTGELSLAALFDEDMLGDDLDAWLAESWMMKRSFRSCALISGLIEKRYPGQEKSGRQVTVSADLIYDVLRAYEPDHILLQAAYADAATGLLDIQRLGDMLKRINGRITHMLLSQISPLAIPIMLDIGKESVRGSADEDILRELADSIDAHRRLP
jgi:ATP-dependent helicase Lhr and Lhr-like helicase